MSWDSVIGHNLQVRILRTAVSTDRLAHAYLFTGPEGTGKESVAFELAKLVNCGQVRNGASPEACGRCESCRMIDDFMHPNVEYVFPVESVLLEQSDPSKAENKRIAEARERYEALIEKKKRNPFFTPSMDRSMGILTDQVAALQQKASFMPPEGGKKVFIVSQPEKLLTAAANKLLKLLEEPPEHVLFILVTSRPESVLPTIRSRCQVLKFPRIRPADMELWLSSAHAQLGEETRRFIVNFSRGNLGTAAELAATAGESGDDTFAGLAIRNRAVEFLRIVLSPGRLDEAVSETETIAKNLGRQEIVSLLGALLLFFQDINHRRIDPSWDALNNPDLAEPVDRFVRNFSAPDFHALSKVTEETIRTIQRNGNPLLTLGAFTIRLKRLLRRA